MKKVIKMPLRRAPQRARPPAAGLRARTATAEETYEEEDYEDGEEPNMKFSHALVVVLVLHLVAVGGVFAFNWMKSVQTLESKSAKPAALAASATAEKPAAAPAAKPAGSASIEGWQGKTHTVNANDTLTRIATVQGTSVEALEKENGITSYSIIQVGQVLKIPGGVKSAPVAKVESAPAKAAGDPHTAAKKQAFIATKTGAAPVKPTATVVKPAAISAVPKSSTAEPAPFPAPVAAKAVPAPAATSDTYLVAKGDNPYTIAKKLHVSFNDLMAANSITDPTKIQIGQKLKVPTKKN